MWIYIHDSKCEDDSDEYYVLSHDYVSLHAVWSVSYKPYIYNTIIWMVSWL